MAKPIFLIKLSADITTEKSKTIASATEMRLNNEYHVLVVAALPTGSEATFECFNADKALEIDIEELKRLING